MMAKLFYLCWRAELQRDLAQLDLDFALAQAGANPTTAQQHQIERLTLLLHLAQLDVDPQLAAAVDAAALRVAGLENMIAQAVLTAPFDGQITALNISAGRSAA
jgi:multidrug resistance efflux pump